MKKFLKSLYLKKRFFIVFFSLAVLFVVSYFFQELFGIARLLFYLLLVAFVFDVLLLYRNKTGIQAQRILPEKLSNGDENSIEIKIVNRFQFKTSVKIIDELPIQWQIRDFKIEAVLNASEEKKFTYHVRPTERGEYHFGNLNVFSSSILGIGRAHV